MPLPEYYMPEIYPFELARKKFEERTGKDLCAIIKRGLEETPKRIEESVEEQNWKKVKTEINRLNILTNGGVTGYIYIQKVVANLLKEDYKTVEKRLIKWRRTFGKKTSCIAKAMLDLE